jgi:hypothetical protein
MYTLQICENRNFQSISVDPFCIEKKTDIGTVITGYHKFMIHYRNIRNGLCFMEKGAKFDPSPKI